MFVTSVILHAALLIIALVGLGSAKPLEPEVVESIAVDLVPITDVTNIRAGSLDSKIVETDTPAVAESDKPARSWRKDRQHHRRPGDAGRDQQVDTGAGGEHGARPTPADPSPSRSRHRPRIRRRRHPIRPRRLNPRRRRKNPARPAGRDRHADRCAGGAASWMPATRPAQLQKSPTKADADQRSRPTPKPVDTPKADEKPPTNSTRRPRRRRTRRARRPSRTPKPADQVADRSIPEDSRGATTWPGRHADAGQDHRQGGDADAEPARWAGGADQEPA